MTIEVHLDDGDGISFKEAADWAASNCVGYRGVTIVDTSDVYVADEIATYAFDNSADAAWFTMRWKGRNYGTQN